jgi:hypothetical protein
MPKKGQVNENYLDNFYDPTFLDKEDRIRDLKHKIIELKNRLGIKTGDNLNYIVNIKNNTIPIHTSEVYANINRIDITKNNTNINNKTNILQ